MDSATDRGARFADVEISTKTGDDGTTGLYYGGRVAKNDAAPRAYGAVDEAQAAIGMARATTVRDDELDAILISLCKDLYVAMAELATAPKNRSKLEAGSTLVTLEMVEHLDNVGDDVSTRFAMPTEFVVPGQTELAARLDVARTLVRRAERDCIGWASEESAVIPYLNRLSDLLWTLARWQEGTSLPTKSSPS